MARVTKRFVVLSFGNQEVEETKRQGNGGGKGVNLKSYRIWFYNLANGSLVNKTVYHLNSALYCLDIHQEKKLFYDASSRILLQIK